MRSLAEWLEQQQRSHPSSIDLGLARVSEVARRLDLLEPDSPRDHHRRHRTARARRSRISMRCCAQGGLRCGRFTSPHLTRYNERICIDGVGSE
jgi:dihydrofolate synthase/folylpolyglutamate synthase